MVQINFALKEVNCKIVYYGPGLSGKTTNLEVVHAKAPDENKGEMTSIATEGDRTLFFDFLPLNLGSIAGMKTKFQLYTVPGQVFYNSTRKLVLQGVDGIVFVADSRQGKMDENIESMENLRENLEEYNLDIDNLSIVLQYNKRDLDDIYSIEEMETKLNMFNAPYIEASALTGEGVFPTLKKLAGMVLEKLNRQQASTTVRRPIKSKKPAMATAGGGAPAAASASAAGPSAQSQQGSAAPTGPAPAAQTPPAQDGPRTVTAKVADGVKKIERKVPVKPRPRPAQPQRPAAAKAAPPGQPAQTAPQPAATGAVNVTKKKSKAWLYVLLTLMALGGASGALYYMGYLEKILRFFQQ